MSETSKLEDKDNILNVLFALVRENDDSEHLFIDKKDIEDVLDNIKKVRDHFPYLDLYDMPDLSANALKRNRHVLYVTVTDEIAFDIDKEEADELIERNQELVAIISGFALIDQFNALIMAMTGNKFCFEKQDPNSVYELAYQFYGANKKRHELYTDGKITVLEEQPNYKKVKVDNATYAIYSAYEGNNVIGAIIKSNDINPYHLEMLLEEVKNLSIGNKTGYEAKDKILMKRRVH